MPRRTTRRRSIDILTIRPQNVILLYIFAFGTAFAPLIGAGQRNYLVIVFCVLAVPTIFLLRINISRDLPLVFVVLFYSLLITVMVGTPDDYSTLAYTSLFSAAYLAVAGSLRSGFLQRDTLANLLKWLIFLFAFVSVLQLMTSLSGLPAPNLIQSKGLWSYNSLAVEPSHAGRMLVMTMLVYLLLARRKEDSTGGLLELLRRQWLVLVSFSVGIALTGSALAILFAPLALVLALSKRWVLFLAGVLLLSWPALYSIDAPALQRALNFLSALPTMDIPTIVQADHSGAVRVMPFLVYLKDAIPGELAFWLGGGSDAVRFQFEGQLIGVPNSTTAGFLPGFLINFGVVGALLFLYTFVFRFISRFTIPIVVIWMLLFAPAAWNTQLFWYGLILLRVAFHFRNPSVLRYQAAPPLERRVSNLSSDR